MLQKLSGPGKLGLRGAGLNGLPFGASLDAVSFDRWIVSSRMFELNYPMLTNG